MFEHFILMSSSYKRGTRIALHHVFTGGVDKNKIDDSIKKIYESIGDYARFSSHYVCTEADTWDSVMAYDPFFSDTYLVDSLEEFIYLMKKDLHITGLDIAKYILSMHPCTHLELEKLTYLCYADYLCKYGKPICEDTIYAFRYGPVLDTVYDKYSRIKETLSFADIDTAKSRLLVDGSYDRIKSIDETVEKYGKCSSSALVRITHSENSPWRMKDATKLYREIDDELIKSRHCYEVRYFDNHYARS